MQWQHFGYCPRFIPYSNDSVGDWSEEADGGKLKVKA